MSTALAIPINNDISTHNRVSFLFLKPEEMIEQASKLATSLARIIKDKGLFTHVNGNDHVHVEGWTTLGALLGVLPREKDVKELPDSSFESHVELYCIHSNQVVGQGSALCGMDENWGSAKKYARRSMASTRATGKAYRLSFGWIMVLAGYHVTPFEEMPTDGSNLFKNSNGGENKQNNDENFQKDFVVLDCPKHEKDELKAMAGKGAKWDPNTFKWSSNHIEAIKRWGPKQAVQTDYEEPPIEIEIPFHQIPF